MIAGLMIIHHLRHAAFVLEDGPLFLLVDPMLGARGRQMPFTLFRSPPRRNPLVDLPGRCGDVLDKVTHGLVTHLHPDHLDRAGLDFLRERGIPTTLGFPVKKWLRSAGWEPTEAPPAWETRDFLGGTITSVPAYHGSGFIEPLMGSGKGFVFRLPGGRAAYVSGDTVYTPDVEKALDDFKPDLAVVAAGAARLDVGKPITMTLDETVRFVRRAPGRVYANHLEAVNHCPVTRDALRERLAAEGLLDKVMIPEDGESFSI